MLEAYLATHLNSIYFCQIIFWFCKLFYWKTSSQTYLFSYINSIYFFNQLWVQNEFFEYVKLKPYISAWIKSNNFLKHWSVNYSNQARGDINHGYGFENLLAKVPVTELTLLHTKSTWECREERIRAVGL